MGVLAAKIVMFQTADSALESYTIAPRRFAVAKMLFLTLVLPPPEVYTCLCDRVWLFLEDIKQCQRGN